MLIICCSDFCRHTSSFSLIILLRFCSGKNPQQTTPPSSHGTCPNRSDVNRNKVKELSWKTADVRCTLCVKEIYHYFSALVNFFSCSASSDKADNILMNLMWCWCWFLLTAGKFCNKVSRRAVRWRVMLNHCHLIQSCGDSLLFRWRGNPQDSESDKSRLWNFTGKYFVSTFNWVHQD